MDTMPDSVREVTGGVDTHKDVHVAAAFDELGRLLDTNAFPATLPGYRKLHQWLVAFGPVGRVGIEGTGSYGAGLSRYLSSRAVQVIEVDRPNRQRRRRKGKSDTIDAISAGRAVLGGDAAATPKTGDGAVESLRLLRVAHRSAVRARTQAANQIHAVIDTGPNEIRARLRKDSLTTLCSVLARSRPGAALSDPVTAAKTALRSLARRWLALGEEIDELNAQITALTHIAAPPALLAEFGVGIDVAGALLVTVGDNPERINSEASFAALCGVSAIDASSGRQQRHRLNRGGNREANAALWRIAMVRLRWDPETKAYVARRISEGKTKREAIRCLKRYLARRIYKILEAHVMSLKVSP